MNHQQITFPSKTARMSARTQRPLCHVRLHESAWFASPLTKQQTKCENTRRSTKIVRLMKTNQNNGNFSDDFPRCRNLSEKFISGKHWKNQCRQIGRTEDYAEKEKLHLQIKIVTSAHHQHHNGALVSQKSDKSFCSCDIRVNSSCSGQFFLFQDVIVSWA